MIITCLTASMIDFLDIVEMWILICVTIVPIWKEGGPFATG